MAKERKASDSDGRYDIRMDNLAYMNMPEQEEYLNPISSGSEVGNSWKMGVSGSENKLTKSSSKKEPRALPETPPPPERDVTPPPPRKELTPARREVTPPPPKRDISLSGKSSEENLTVHRTASNSRYPRMGNGFTSLERNSGNDKVVLRQKNSAFDSGVGDLEHVHIDGMNQNKNYDYADYGHQYEELPNRKSIAKCPMDSGMDSRSEHYQSSGGATDITSETEDTTNIVNHRGEKRKRVNPLYDAMTQSMPSIYNKQKSPSDESLRQQIRCLKCALIVFIVLTCAAIAVSVFAIINYNQTKNDPDPLLTPRVQKLTDDYSRMETLLSSFDDSNDTMKVLSNVVQRVKMLEQNLSSQIISLNQQLLNTQIGVQNNAQDIVHTQTNTSSAMSFLNMTLQLQLHNISKQQGPQGPQGVANFSQCSYKNETKNTVASDVFPSYTVWLPTEVELENNIALTAFCSVEGGTVYHLEVHPLSPQTVQYRCKCSGVVASKSQRSCTLHYLQCPRYS